MKKLTPYKDINEIATWFANDLKEILGGQLAGLYLTGSLTYGDFDRGSSDLDFVVVMKKPFSDDQRKKVKEMHANVEKLYPEWAKRIEMPYILQNLLGSMEPPKTTKPYFNAGELWDPDPPYGNNWLINLYALREFGIALVGPDIKSFIRPIVMKDVREASSRDLHERWQEKLDSAEPFGDGKYWDTSLMQTYTILTMCRKLYRAKNSGADSKRVSSKWAKENYPKWKDLIEKAEKWQMGQTMDSADETLVFIRFTLKEIG